MLLEALRLVAVVGLLVVVPGWLLVTALFPRRESLRPTERAYLAIAGGILLVVAVGVILGFLPHGSGRGHFQTLATGMPNVELAMLAVSALLFWIGVQRGAHAWAVRRFPQLAPATAKAGAPAPAREQQP